MGAVCFDTTTELEEELRRKLTEEREKEYLLVLHDDDDHTYEYVIEMLTTVLQISVVQAFEHAVEVDTRKTTVLKHGPLEMLETFQVQIQNFGPDPRLQRSRGPMRTTIEPV